MSEKPPLLDLSTLDFRPKWAKESVGHTSQERAPLPREFREDVPRPHERHGKKKFQRGGFGGRKGPREDRREPPREKRPLPPANPLPWLRFAFTATPPAVETVVQQIRHTGKTFSLFDIARILLRNPASYIIELSARPPAAEGPFYKARVDGSVWLSRTAAVQHLLRTKLDQFYSATTVDIEPPKGNFTVVAVCGMSGTLLGPPNLHDYERRLRELHRQKFAHMDFEKFRARLTMDRSPETIEKWRLSASKVVEFYPKECESPEKLQGLEAVEKHFLAHYAEAGIEALTTCDIPGDVTATAVDSVLVPLLARAREEEERFPLRLAQSLSRALTQAGLRFRKSPNRTTWVSAARPRHLDATQVAVRDSIRRILEVIGENKGIRRGELLDLLAPPPTSAPEAVTAAGSMVALPADPARQAVMEELLWLTHEGYVIEFSDGRLEVVPPPQQHPHSAKSAE